MIVADFRIKFNKCTFASSLEGSGRPTENYLYNCRCLGSVSIGYSKLNVVNSYICRALNTNSSSGGFFVINSVVGCGVSNSTYLWIYNSTFYNSILFNNSSSANNYSNARFPSSNFVYYCVGKNGDGSIFNEVAGYDDGSGHYIPNNTNTVISDLSTIFKTFNGQNYNEYETFELTTAAASTYLGDDNTQVGMYGGSMPYDPFPSHPIITKLTVAEKSTPQGKLSVDIEVKPAQ